MNEEKKTGYQIRQELLQQAQSILEHRFHSNLELSQRLGNSLKFHPPTTDEIVLEATKLYKFVCTK